MSSANKTLKTSDITVFPYRANKNYVIASSSFFSSSINIFTGVNVIPSTTGSVPQSALYYRSVRQLYYSHYTPSLAPTIPLSEQDYDQLQEDQIGSKKTNNVLVYNNYLQSTAASGSSELDFRGHFPTASNAQVTILSIPTLLYGESIKPGSFAISSSVRTLSDDANGNIIISGSTTHVGNILYAHGIIVVTNPSYLTIFPAGSPQDTLYFTSTYTIYENQVRCHASENEFNITQNPSATSGSTGVLNNNITGSSFQPYVTTIGLYNAANELLATGKLGQPFPMPTNTDVTFVVKWDS